MVTFSLSCLIGLVVAESFRGGIDFGNVDSLSFMEVVVWDDVLVSADDGENSV